MTRRKFQRLVTDNGSYKVVALFVSLALWVTILGRKDLILNHDMQLQLLTNTNHVIRNKIRETVRVKVSGPRSGLKKFTQSGEVISINLEKVEPGRRTIKIPKDGLNLPLGVKVLSITPSRIQVSIREVKPLLEESEESGE
tara:strand:+ start:538 stop:960 length:423 start_codon:yes stop_codon:yes gene_type:complete